MSDRDESSRIFREYSKNPIEFEDHTEEFVWKVADPEDLWVMDKLIVAKKMGYIAGPVGTSVPFEDKYIVRPCVNAIGLGLGAQIYHLNGSTDHLPVGHFWSEIFQGDHYSVDFFYGEQYIAVKGYKSGNTLSHWDGWVRDDTKHFDLPDILGEIPFKYPWVNCEFIGGHLIEVHLRMNMDFNHIDDQKEYIPVWEGQDITPPMGYLYVADPDVHGRIGAFVR